MVVSFVCVCHWNVLVTAPAASLLKGSKVLRHGKEIPMGNSTEMEGLVSQIHQVSYSLHLFTFLCFWDSSRSLHSQTLYL